MKSRFGSISFLLMALAVIFACEEKPTEPEATGNHLPQIVQITANPAQLNTLGSTNLTCEVQDADGDSILYTWSCTAGTFPAGNYLSSVIWTAPADTGDYVISVTIDDGRMGQQDSSLVIADSITISVDYNVLSGSLSGFLEQNVYLVAADIQVAAGDSLLIDPGAEFRFAAEVSFTVNGYLSAIGTYTDSIIFEPDEGVTSWEGITCSMSGKTGLSYCLITGSSSSGVTIRSSDVVLSNSKVTGNSAARGGGVAIFDSDPMIVDCAINSNSATDDGGGIYCEEASPDIGYSTIQNNSAVHFGGGIACETQSGPVIANCLIADNSAEVQGGGLYAYWQSNVLMTQCTLTHNTAAFGGAAFFMDADPVITRTVIYENSSDDDGGGIFCNSSVPLIEHCTISGNTGGDQGGGIFFKASDPNLLNSILESNSGGGGIYFESSPGADVTYCDFYANQDTTFTGDPDAALGALTLVNTNGDSVDIYSNVFADPLFIDASGGDFHLQWGSPCIDAGNPVSPADPNGTTADIGAFYYNQ